MAMARSPKAACRREASAANSSAHWGVHSASCTVPWDKPGNAGWLIGSAPLLPLPLPCLWSHRTDRANNKFRIQRELRPSASLRGDNALEALLSPYRLTVLPLFPATACSAPAGPESWVPV